MAIGRSRKKSAQGEFWVDTQRLPKPPGHPFYARLNALLQQHGFDARAEGLCARFYAGHVGRPGLAPGVYFRMLFIGYFEGIGSDRGIAWRVEDSLALRDFLGFALTERTPDHSTLSDTRRRIDLETHQEVFQLVLGMVAREGLLKGRDIGMDTTTLEANAAMRSIVRRDTGEGYREFLTELARESGIQSPTRAELARLDKSRKNKASNDDWTHPHDPDARIARMKNGSTHMAYKAEHAVDLETGALVAVTVQCADMDDREMLPATLLQAREHLYCAAQDEMTRQHMKALRHLVADKGYHSTAILRTLAREHHLRPCISEAQRGRRTWKGRAEEQELVYANRRTIHSRHGKALHKKRGEIVERSFAHLYESGALRRMTLRGQEAIRKRVFIQGAAHNLSLLMRRLCGAGTPKQHKTPQTALIPAFLRLCARMAQAMAIFQPQTTPTTQRIHAA